MIAVLSAAGAWIARRFAAWGIGSVATLAFLGPFGPVITGIANAIGAMITAIFDIVLALAKSAEGRVILAILAAAAGFLYLRFHYIEEGKAEARAHCASIHKPCPANGYARGRR